MDKTSPKVSIILPTYNGVKYIRQSIDSCLNQTYENIEIIIVDDGSIDGTIDIVNQYRDKRIIFFKNKENKGLPIALNTGFSEASGDYLTWTSDDNLYAKEAIEKMLHFLIRKNCSFVYCNYYKFKDLNLNSRFIVKLPEEVCLEKGNMIGPCFMYSRKVMESIGEYDPVTELAEDYDFWIRVSKIFSMVHFDEPLYFFRIHDESLSISKYYEVLIVGFLVMLKNNISNINHVTNLFLDLIRQKREGFFKLLILYKILYARKINIILRQYKSGMLNFETAKLKLNNIVFPKIPQINYRSVQSDQK
jgi:glycosyltransferase involved in cell wall biosynthesis